MFWLHLNRIKLYKKKITQNEKLENDPKLTFFFEWFDLLFNQCK